MADIYWHVCYIYPLAHFFGDCRHEALTEEQRRKLEQELKHRQFVEQQKRLQEYSSLGGRRKMNADTLIESIIGKTEHTMGKMTKLNATTPTSPMTTGMMSSIATGMMSLRCVHTLTWI